MSLLLVVWAGRAEAVQSSQTRFIQTLDRMMVALGPESARDSRLIRQAYKEHLDLLVLEDYRALEEAHWNGGLAPLPADPTRFNLSPRLSGHSPIGEMDLANQVGYVAARPAAVGALLEIASRVKSGPLEVTSLVRHAEYQGALRATNANANTAVPMHTMGLAFDIALVNTPLETVYEIRDVLRQMRKEGKILFVGERRQLVFHVVPHPSQLGHYTGIYTQALGMPPADAFSPVVALAHAKNAGTAHGRPRVTAEVVAVVPTSEIANEWWAADHAHGDYGVDVMPVPVEEPALALEPILAGPPPGAPLASALLLLAALLTGTRVVLTRRRTTPGLRLSAVDEGVVE